MKAILITLCGLIFCTITQATVVTGKTDTAAEAAALPEGEIRLRNGIIILGKICQTMAEVNNQSSAEAAVPKLLALNEELRQWTQSFTNLPPLSESEVLAYEDRYLPTIRKINHIIDAQAGRLAAAEYYGSLNLPAALVRIAQIGHP